MAEKSLRCYGFEVSPSVLKDLASKVSLSELDLYCCRLINFNEEIPILDQIANYRNMPQETLQLLLDYHTSLTKLHTF